MAFLRDYKLTVPAGRSELIDLNADGFSCVETNLTSFQLQIDSQSAVTFEQQHEFTAPPGEVINKLRIINIDQVNALVVTLKIWSGAFRDRRTVFNQVESFEPETLENISAKSFMLNIQGTPTPSRRGVFNPAGSGKLIGVKGVQLSITPRADIQDPHPWIILESTASTPDGTLFDRSFSNFLGSPAGVAELYNDDGTAFVREKFMMLISQEGLNSKHIKLSSPLLIPEGRGMLIFSSPSNKEYFMTLELIEVDG